MTEPTPFIDGYRLIDGTELNYSLANPNWSIAPSVTATTSGSVTTSYKIVETVTQVTNAAAPNAGVVLPQALPGRVLLIINESPFTITVYAEGGSNITGSNGGAPGNIGVSQVVNGASYYIAVQVNEWYKLDFFPIGFQSLYVETLTNITALRNWSLLPGSSPAQISLVYNNAPGDGGGIFYIDPTDNTTPDNGTTVIVDAVGNRWKREQVQATYIQNVPAGIVTATNVQAAINQLAGFIVNIPLEIKSTITALRATAVSTAFNVFLNGYYTNGDGGGGFFYGVTGAAPGTYVDNGGTIIVPGDGSSAWLRFVSNTINAIEFGAIGDGVTDDTVAIQNAMLAVSGIGGTLEFQEGKTYITGTLGPQSNLTMNLNGATLKLKAGTFERIFAGDVGGQYFAVLNGTLDGNQANNSGNYNLSGASNFINWTNLTFKNLTWQNVFRSCLILDGTTNNVVIENVKMVNCGALNGFGLFSYGIELYGTSFISIKNFYMADIFGYAIHFIGTTDFIAENLTFKNFTQGGASITITWTEAKRGVCRNILCENIDGTALEMNASTEQVVENVKISTSFIAILMGDNSTGIYNENCIWRNVVTTGTTGPRAVATNFMNNVLFEKMNIDGAWQTLAAITDRNNTLTDSIVLGSLPVDFTYYNKFAIKRTQFSNFYINDFNEGWAIFSPPNVPPIGCGVTVPAGGFTYIDFDGFNSMGPSGFVNGRLRATSWFNAQQGSYYECIFLGSNNNVTFNVASIINVDNLIARALTITGDAANRRLSIQNSSADPVVVYWVVELNKASY